MQPGHGNYFCLLGGDEGQRRRFRECFGQFGRYHSPRRLPRPKRRLPLRILEALIVHGPMAKRPLARLVRARNADVSQTVNDMAKAGVLERHGRSWSVKPGALERFERLMEDET